MLYSLIQAFYQVQAWEVLSGADTEGNVNLINVFRFDWFAIRPEGAVQLDNNLAEMQRFTNFYVKP